MTFLQRLFASLWWGTFRVPFEAIARRLMRNSTRIVTGPLKGFYFVGGLSQKLGIYEYRVQEALLSRLKPGDVLYDIGGNTGYMSLIASTRVSSTGHIHIFEPFPPNVEAIKQTLASNKIANCTLIAQAVSDTSGEADLFLASEDSATPTLLSEHTGRIIRVQTITLNDFLTPDNTPTLIKLDVEGAEVAVIKGASQLFDLPAPPTWLIEVHSAENASWLRTFFAECGYHITDLPGLRRRAEQYPAHIIASRNAY